MTLCITGINSSWTKLCWIMLEVSPNFQRKFKIWKKKIVLKILRNTSALCSVGHTTVSITRYQLWTKMRRLYIAQPYCFVRDTGQMGSQPVWKQKYIWKCNYLNKHFHTKKKCFGAFREISVYRGKKNHAQFKTQLLTSSAAMQLPIATSWKAPAAALETGTSSWHTRLWSFHWRTIFKE